MAVTVARAGNWSQTMEGCTRKLKQQLTCPKHDIKRLSGLSLVAADQGSRLDWGVRFPLTPSRVDKAFSLWYI